MTTTQIIGGSVKYTVPSNYNTGKDGCEATIHFTVAEGDGASAHAMGDLARTEATRLATGTDRPYENDDASRRGLQAAPAPFVAASAPALSPVPPVGAPAVSSAPAVATPVIVQSPVETAQPGPIVTSAASPIETGAAPQITDEQLKDAAMHHQARILGAAPKDQVSQETAARKISALIAVYVQPPKTLYSISQDRRQAFLDGLAKIGTPEEGQ